MLSEISDEQIEKATVVMRKLEEVTNVQEEMEEGEIDT